MKDKVSRKQNNLAVEMTELGSQIKDAYMSGDVGKAKMLKEQFDNLGKRNIGFIN